MIKQSHYRTPRTTGECRWNPHMAPIEKSFRPHKNARLDRWIKVLGLVAIILCLLALGGCGKKVDDAFKEMREAPVPTKAIGKTGPDEHGVVCYYSMGSSPSCVKVQ